MSLTKKQTENKWMITTHKILSFKSVHRRISICKQRILILFLRASISNMRLAVLMHAQHSMKQWLCGSNGLVKLLLKSITEMQHVLYAYIIHSSRVKCLFLLSFKLSKHKDHAYGAHSVSDMVQVEHIFIILSKRCRSEYSTIR